MAVWEEAGLPERAAPPTCLAVLLRRGSEQQPALLGGPSHHHRVAFHRDSGHLPPEHLGQLSRAVHLQCQLPDLHHELIPGVLQPPVAHLGGGCGSGGQPRRRQRLCHGQGLLVSDSVPEKTLHSLGAIRTEPLKPPPEARTVSLQFLRFRARTGPRARQHPEASSAELGFEPRPCQGNRRPGSVRRCFWHLRFPGEATMAQGG